MGEWILIGGIGGFFNGVFGVWGFLGSIWSIVRRVGRVGFLFGNLFGIQKILDEKLFYIFWGFEVV